jgi:hypothetical protein
MHMVTSNEQQVVERASDDQGMLTKPELANRLRKSVRTIDAWMKGGPRIPYVKIGSKSVLFKWDSVLQWLNEFRVN